MTKFILFTSMGRYLLERRLRESSVDESWIILCEGKDAVAVSNLKKRFNSIEKVITIDTEWDPKMVWTGALITLPISFESRPLFYRPEIEIPWLPEYYSLFNKVWKLGFREVALYNLFGTRHIPVPYMLDCFWNVHRGKRCFVVGNGPSLNLINMKLLRDEVTLGSNQCYLGYTEWGFEFTYWGISDQYQIEAYDKEYQQYVKNHKTHFFPFEYLPLLSLPNACPVNIVWCKEQSHQFSDKPSHIYRGYTVTYMLLQIAAVMGCNPIILIGVDHEYPLHLRQRDILGLRKLRRFCTRKIRHRQLYRLANAVRIELVRNRKGEETLTSERLWDIEHCKAPTHFSDKYTEAGKRKFKLPEPREAEADFTCAKRWSEENNIEILNATPGSKLKIFKTISFSDLF